MNSKSAIQSWTDLDHTCLMGFNQSRWRMVPTRIPGSFGPSPTDVEYIGDRRSALRAIGLLSLIAAFSDLDVYLHLTTEQLER
jgi:hypothetical protein